MDIAVYLSSPHEFRGGCLSDYPFTFGDHRANLVAAAYQNMCDMLAKSGVHRFTYLYFGAEFCEYLIPSQQDLEQYVEICRANDLRPVFVTPVVTDRGLDRLWECFDHLDASGIPYAVVVNDLGVLQMLCSRSPVPELIAGRILDKTSHDCRISENEMGSYYSASGMRYASEPGILSDHSTGVLSPLGISRYEFDLPKTGLDLKHSGSGLSLYWPFHYLTTGRVCMFRALGKTGKERFLVGQRSCGGSCKALELEMRKPINGYSFEHGVRKNNQYLFQKGNTIFYLYENPNITEQIEQFDRIVLQLL